MKEQEIGIANIKYKQDGSVFSADFTPSKVNLGGGFGPPNQLLNIKQGTAEEIKNNAELVMASWYSKMNEIELADRNQYEIKGEIIRCDKYPDGAVMQCEVRFVFKQIGPGINMN
jgi:hypothetical protein